MTKDEILAELHRTRSAISTDTIHLRQELDIQAKLNAVVRKKPLAWIGGAAALGWWLAGPKTRTRVVTKTVDGQGRRVKAKKKKGGFGRFGILFALLRFAFPYLKPALSSYAVQFLGRWIGGNDEELSRLSPQKR